MTKIYIFTAIIALFASVALAPVGVFAQYYAYPTYNGSTVNYGSTPAYVAPQPTYTQPMNSAACINLTYNLYKGLFDASTGGQVSILQSFLISQRYLNVARPTGYFGVLTYQALLQYQYAHQLPASGSIDVATRASIQTVSCNGTGYNNGYNNGYAYGAPVLTSLSATSGPVGMSVSIFGSGFDLFNNTVNFNGIPMSGIPSYNGTAIAFVVPQVYGQIYNNYSNYSNQNIYNNSGSYPITVTSSHGISNTLSFTVTSGGINNGGYCNGIYYNGGYNNTYNGNCYNNNNNNGPISISNVSGPTSLQVGTQGLWSLSLYNPNTNYVTVSARWGDENTYNYYGTASAQAAQSSYTQGQQTITFSHTYQTSGTYTVVFTATSNQGVQTSVSATVNVSGNGYNNGNQPYLSSISPSSGRVGTQVVINGSGFTPTGNTIHFGNGGMSNVSSTNSGNTIYYTIPYSVGPCDITTGSYICATYEQQITPGSYPVYVSNAYGQTSTTYFTVTY